MGADRGGRDYLLYGAATAIVCAIGITWYVARGMLRHAEGRDVQALMTRVNLNSEESFRRQARNYVAELARNKALTGSQRKKAEEVFSEAFEERMRIWVDARLAGLSESETRARSNASWERYMLKYRAILAEE